jgi:hypothetical protein
MASPSNNNNNEEDRAVRRGEQSGQDTESNVSFGSNEEDPILTATITFDVTVDPNGQVISTSEGQIIAESIQNPSESRRGLSLSDQVNQQPPGENYGSATSASNPYSNAPSGIQADSLASMDSRPPAVRRPGGNGHDSDSDESTSTTTESLIERSKKYMGDEAGIIILKREDSVPKNYDINMDFDLNNPDNNNNNNNTQSQTNTIHEDNEDDDSSQHQRNYRPQRRAPDDDEEDDDLEEDDEEDGGKAFNINLDFDFQKVPRGDGDNEEDEEEYDDAPKGFNINLDFDLNDPKQNGRNTGVDIDLMITSDSKVETTEVVEDEDARGRYGVK